VPTKPKPIHPGEILREEFMVPLGLSAAKLAKALRVPVSRVANIANERNGISRDMARRLARHFGMSVEFWLNLRASYRSRRPSRLASSSRT
jgi:antitoxin HigA-1